MGCIHQIQQQLCNFINLKLLTQIKSSLCYQVHQRKSCHNKGNQGKVVNQQESQKSYILDWTFVNYFSFFLLTTLPSKVSVLWSKKWVNKSIIFLDSFASVR